MKTPSFTHLLKNGKTIDLRSVRPQDAEAIIRLRQQIAHESTHTMQYVGMPNPNLEKVTESLQRLATEEGALSLGAFDGERLLGYLTFNLSRPGHPWVRHLGQFGMFIAKEFWGMGLGKRLLEIQEGHARENRVNRIEALVRAKNEAGVKLYLRQGFVIEGIRKQGALIQGEVQDEYFIAKILDQPFANWQPPEIETSRLLLRPITEADAPALFAYAKNSKIAEQTLWDAHANEKVSLDFIRDYVFPNYAQGTPEPWALCLKDDLNKMIGTVGCFPVSPKPQAMELAYALSEAHWGKGLMPEAANAVMEHCFRVYALKRIQARCKTANLASAQVMKKCGMEFEGTLRSAAFHRGIFHDMHYYSKIQVGEESNFSNSRNFSLAPTPI